CRSSGSPCGVTSICCGRCYRGKCT
nr:omega-SVIA=Ca channel-targeted omega-conotoxin [Conus striatus, venom, Peptide, 24 aa] [Conus striatus]